MHQSEGVQEQHEAPSLKRLRRPAATLAQLQEVTAKADARVRAGRGADRRELLWFVGQLREGVGERLLDRLLR